MRRPWQLTSVVSAVLFILSFSATGSSQSPEVIVDRLLANPQFKAAQAYLDNDYDRIVREIIQITEIEAPPFKERNRAQAYLGMLKQAGLTNVEMDAEGNVLGVRKGAGDGPLIAIAAHLDTVFPEGTNVKVKREGSRLYAPGVGDNSMALAVLLALIRALDAAKIQTRGDILFVGNVGEEGEGDLRGMKYLFLKGPYKDKITAFITIDGAGPGSSIVNGATGSKRYRVTFRGPGGHSSGSFGLVNPAYAMAKAIDKFSRMQVPSSPRTTFNVGVMSGGISVNSIPAEVWMEVDMRSDSPEELGKLAETFLGLMQEAVAEENKVRSTAQGRIQLDIKLIGDRPTGATPTGSTLVQSASAAARAFGLNSSYGFSSTDANTPISLRIPAIRINGGGSGGRNHSPEEWIDVEKTAMIRGMTIAMTTLLAMAGVR
jgi:acetylornithine deacetylase/succinyl-diaminopimelate desuccinylase-like protein